MSPSWNQVWFESVCKIAWRASSSQATANVLPHGCNCLNLFSFRKYNAYSTDFLAFVLLTKYYRFALHNINTLPITNIFTYIRVNYQNTRQNWLRCKISLQRGWCGPRFESRQSTFHLLRSLYTHKQIFLLGVGICCLFCAVYSVYEYLYLYLYFMCVFLYFFLCV